MPNFSTYSTAETDFATLMLSNYSKFISPKANEEAEKKGKYSLAHRYSTDENREVIYEIMQQGKYKSIYPILRYFSYGLPTKYIQEIRTELEEVNSAEDYKNYVKTKITNLRDNPECLLIRRGLNTKNIDAPTQKLILDNFDKITQQAKIPLHYLANISNNQLLNLIKIINSNIFEQIKRQIQGPSEKYLLVICQSDEAVQNLVDLITNGKFEILKSLYNAVNTSFSQCYGQFFDTILACCNDNDSFQGLIESLDSGILQKLVIDKKYHIYDVIPNLCYDKIFDNRFIDNDCKKIRAELILMLKDKSFDKYIEYNPNYIRSSCPLSNFFLRNRLSYAIYQRICDIKQQTELQNNINNRITLKSIISKFFK